MRMTLVATELALTLILLTGAGLLVRSFTNLLAVPPGFDTEHLLTFTTSVPQATYREPAARAAFLERAAQAFELLPGVRAVTMSTTLPVSGRGSGAWFTMVDRPWPRGHTPPGVANRIVRSNYFQALGIPLLRGRHFTPADRLDGSRAVIVSEAVAPRFWPGDDPIGRHIHLGAPDNRIVDNAEIVGVAADVKQQGLAEASPEAVYVPHGMMPAVSNIQFAIRTAGEPESLASAVRETLRQLDPAVPIVRMETMDAVLARATTGTAGALTLTRLMDTLLFGVSPTDPVTFAAVSALLALVAALACYLPARRAARVDPAASCANRSRLCKQSLARKVRSSCATPHSCAAVRAHGATTPPGGKRLSNNSGWHDARSADGRCYD